MNANNGTDAPNCGNITSPCDSLESALLLTNVRIEQLASLTKLLMMIIGNKKYFTESSTVSAL